MFFYEERPDIEREGFAIEDGPDVAYPMHLHRCYELAAVWEGSLVTVLNGTEYTLGPGDSILLFPNQPHSYTGEAGCRRRLIIFKPELIAYFDARTRGTVPRCPKKHVDDEPWLEMFRSLSPTSPIERVKGVLYAYCGLIAGDEFVSVSESGIPDDLDLLHRVFAFASEHYTERCSLSDLASGIGYDYSYLSKFFSDKIGYSFTEYVGSLRLDRAMYLLRNTSMSVLDVSESCGYGSLRTFNRNFMKKTGMTPREYRGGAAVKP